jgi:hypothetical protein
VWGEADDGAIDLGGRAEGRGLHDEQFFDGAEGLGGDGEIAVVAGAGLGGEAVSDFALDEEDGADEVGAEGEGFFDDGGGDVVGDIAADDGGAEGGEVGVEDVFFDEFKAGVRGVAEAEGGGEGGVEFDGDEARGAFEEEFGEGAGAGTDFDAEGWGRGAGGVGDALQDGALKEEVLT